MWLGDSKDASSKLLRISLHTDFLCNLLLFPSSMAGPRRCPAIRLWISLAPSLGPLESEDPIEVDCHLIVEENIVPLFHASGYDGRAVGACSHLTMLGWLT